MPPFNNLAARRLREALGMAPGHVAYGMQASYGMAYITADTILSWERGIGAPTSMELTALAGALWCAPGELLGAARTLREHRLARGLAPEDVARAVGIDHDMYLQMEENGKWRGNERESRALADALGLSLRDFSTVTGRDEKLADYLRSAVTAARWQAYEKPIGKLVPMDRYVLADTLEQLHTEYQSRMTATLIWGGTATDAGNSGREFLAGIVDHFWELAATEA